MIDSYVTFFYLSSARFFDIAFDLYQCMNSTRMVTTPLLDCIIQGILNTLAKNISPMPSWP